MRSRTRLPAGADSEIAAARAMRCDPSLGSSSSLVGRRKGSRSRGRLALTLGDWEEAADASTAVMSDPRSAPVARSWALTTLGIIRARRGDSEVAVALDEAHELVHQTAEPDRIAEVAAARAEAAW